MADFSKMTGAQCEVEARRQFQQLARKMIAQGMPAGAVKAGIRELKGLGLRVTTSDRLKAAMGEADDPK